MAGLNGGVLGIGVDLVDVDRIRESLERFGDRFRKRVFLPGECEYCDRMADPAIHFAGRFAAKEAVSKAFGTGIGRQIGWQDIEVVRDAATGEPSVRLAGKAIELAASRGVGRALVSIAHTRASAVAQAVLVGDPGGRETAAP
jgi:holo-[acyl-carrier protein] synthase